MLCRVRKGQTLYIPILPINRSEGLWGKDAREFKYVCIQCLDKNS